MGNICRSPTAHGVFAALVEREGLGERIEIDSAGTHAYHVGEPPDARAQETALKRGVDLSEQQRGKTNYPPQPHQSTTSSSVILRNLSCSAAMSWLQLACQQRSIKKVGKMTIDSKQKQTAKTVCCNKLSDSIEFCEKLDSILTQI